MSCHGLYVWQVNKHDIDLYRCMRQYFPYEIKIFMHCFSDFYKFPNYAKFLSSSIETCPRFMIGLNIFILFRNVHITVSIHTISKDLNGSYS